MSEREQPAQAQTWFLTWTSYGTWLHGDTRGWHDRKTDFYPGKYKADPMLEERRRRQLKHPPVVFTPEMRQAVEAAIHEVCTHRGWKLEAINVRTTHVHAVVVAQRTADDVLRDFKAYATRRLRKDGLLSASMEVWTEGGNKRHLASDEAVAECCNYTLFRQGE